MGPFLFASKIQNVTQINCKKFHPRCQCSFLVCWKQTSDTVLRMSPTGSKSVNQVHVRYGVWTGLKLKVDHDYDRWHRWPKNRWGCASLAVRTERSKSVKILKNQTFRVCWELFNSSNVAALLLEDIMFLPKFQVLLVFTWRHKNSNKKTIDTTEILLSRYIRAAEN